MADASVVVVYRERASDRRALAAAAELDAPLTVVTRAPKEIRSAACGIYTAELDLAVRALAEQELCTARELLGPRAQDTRFVVLETRDEDDLADWARAAGATTALLGARRAMLGIRRRDSARRALARAGLDVRVID